MARGGRLRGQAVTLEAMLVALASIAVLLTLYAWGYSLLSRLSPRPGYATVEAAYCGSLLTLYNLGPGNATVTEIEGYTGSGWVTVPASYPLVIPPGRNATIDTGQAYQKVVAAGEGFKAVVAQQECP